MNATKKLKIQRVTEISEISDLDGRERVIGYVVIDPGRYVSVSAIYVRRAAALVELKRQEALAR